MQDICVCLVCTWNSSNSPMKLVGVRQTCKRRPEIDKEANTTADSLPLGLHLFPAKQSPEANEASQTSSQKTEQVEWLRQQFHRRKQWFHERKLEFIDLYKKYKSKAKAVREFKVRYKVELKSSTYNPWIAQEMTQKSPEGQVQVHRLLIWKWRSSSTMSSKNYEVKASKSKSCASGADARK